MKFHGSGAVTVTSIPTPSGTVPHTVAIRALPRTSKRALALAILAFVALRVALVVEFPFIDSTEARYAEMARLMVTSGDWITPQFSKGVPFWGKPPLHTWLSASGMALFGVNEFGGRVFIFISAIITVAICLIWSRRLRGMDFALIATAILFGNGLFVGAAAFVMTDMPMVLGTTLSMAAFWNCATGYRSRVFGYLFFVGLAIGLLAKGPVALVLVIIALGIYAILQRDWRAGITALPWVRGTLLLMVLVLPWYIAAELKTPGFLRYFLIGEHFERFIVSGWQGDLYGSGHARAKGMIWVGFVIAFFPWVLGYLPPLIRARTLVTMMSSDEKNWVAYLLGWVLAPLILFTPAANILTAYVLPALPAASLLLVELWRIRLRHTSGWMRGKAAVAGFVFCWLFVFGFFAYLLAISDRTDIKPMHRTAAHALSFARPIIETDSSKRILFFGPRVYSADFYSAGRAEYLAGKDELNQALALQISGFLFVRQNTHLPTEATLHLIKTIGPYRIYSLPPPQD